MSMKKSRVLLFVAVLASAVAAYVATAHRAEQARIARPLPAAASAAAGRVDAAVLLDDVRALSSTDFEGRRTGTPGSFKAQAYLQARLRDIGVAPFGRRYAQPFSFTHRSFHGLFSKDEPFSTAYPDATNIIGVIPGTKAPERYLVVSAHYDHLGIVDGRLYPGADDNASGVAAMLAIAAWFKAHPPLHSVVFAAFDAEELGLRGSHAFLDALPFDRDRLAVNLNMDMLAHNDSNQIFVAGTFHYPFLKPWLEQAAARSTVQVFLGHDRSQLIAGAVEDWTDSSDHGPFHAAGIPFLYFGVADHPDYHQPGDTFDHINQAFFIRVANLVVDTAVVLDRHLDELKK
jgi:hypothetical protein